MDYCRSLPKALLCSIAAVFSAGCTTFLKPDTLRYQLPDPSEVAGCFSEYGGYCPSEGTPTAVLSSAGYFSSLASQARAYEVNGIVAVALLGKADPQPLASEAIADAADILSFLTEAKDGEVIAENDLADARVSILSAVAYGAFEELAEATVDVAASDPVARTSQYVSQYLKAYFRSGRFGKIHVDPTKINEQIVAELRERLQGSLPDDQIKILADRLTKKISPQYFGIVKDESFVARGGKVYQFKEITLGVSPGAEKPVTTTKLDGVQVVGEVTRVVFEAMFDARHGLPAVASATGVTQHLGLIENRSCTDEESQADPQGCKQRDLRILDSAKFERVESIASQIDGATLALTGSYLRGVSWFSLNNEYLATFLETAVAVSARKSAEKVAWCYYRCPTGSVDTALARDIRVPMQSKQRQIRK